MKKIGLLLIAVVVCVSFVTPATVDEDAPSLLYPEWMNNRVLLEAWEKTECLVGFHLWLIEPAPMPHKIYHTCAACGKVVEYNY